ncbi:hypothetical protein [Zavarzinia sp.]|uniref:hypothetical protein n=1 Tax=Zavarzinia sp. TaxID=2027920 RepID=UPI00356ABFE7
MASITALESGTAPDATGLLNCSNRAVCGSPDRASNSPGRGPKPKRLAAMNAFWDIITPDPPDAALPLFFGRLFGKIVAAPPRPKCIATRLYRALPQRKNWR